MEDYSKTVVVGPEDLDHLEHVNNVRYLEWIQEVSGEHWQARTRGKILEEVIWVVRSHHIEYRGEAKLGQSIVIKTYIKETRGAISVRAVEMRLAGSDEILVSSETEWCLLSAKSRKPMRISTEIRSLFKESP